MEAEISWVKVGGDGWSWQEGGEGCQNIARNWTIATWSISRILILIQTLVF